jgi:tryptophan-rich sensory protein
MESWKSLLAWVALCFAASIGGIFVSVDGWYAGLAKPSWNPPGWVFGPVWTLLYALMAVAVWLVWRRVGWRLPVYLFLAQWALNAVWTPLFFGMHRIGLALADITLLWVALAATLVAFWRVRPAAGMLLIPYLAWVSFAGVLNGTIWTMNR